MSLRDDLLNLLSDYDGFDTEEDNHVGSLRSFLNGNANPFHRSNLDGHVTASALVINPAGDKTLLTHHHFLDKWLQFGGHIDETDESVLSAAIREAEEESGINGIRPYATGIFDIDAHPIPQNVKKNEPAHIHYDVRFLLVAPHEDYTVSDESQALKWFAKDELQALSDNPNIMRMALKWRALTEQ